MDMTIQQIKTISGDNVFPKTKASAVSIDGLEGNLQELFVELYNRVMQVRVESLTIQGADSISGYTAQYNISFSPVTADGSVIWSIIDGSEYASIDTYSGELTANKAIQNKSVTIKAELVGNTTVFATKTININNIIEPESITIEGPAMISNHTQYRALVSPDNADFKDVNWTVTSSVNGEILIDENGFVTITNLNISEG